MKASDFCTKAAALMEDRGKERDQASGERSMARCVNTFNAMTGHKLTVEDGWLFMVYLKHARMRGGQFKQDDYEDAVAYEALMAEEAVKVDEAVEQERPKFHYTAPISLLSLEDAYDECHPEGCHACTNLNCPRR